LDGLFSGEMIETKGELCFLTVMVDITERKQADELMRSAQEELHRLLHEAEQSRMVLLSVAEDRKIAEDALVKLSEDLIFAYDATLEGWSNALELRERETAGHSQRVVELTVELARSFGINEETLKHMQRGALLHDIGKMGIPDSILLKPGPLTDEEWVIMRQHPLYAYRLLAGIPYLQPALDIPYCHHERWDGSGYPCGLKGKDIPLAARIFAIVDVWDALSSDRPYRPAWTADSILNYLKEQSGKHFDPEVVEKFMTAISVYSVATTDFQKET
jgi:HD-GYP domain-containing protein (c-di-GMP phosphodiesterase class II)